MTFIWPWMLLSLLLVPLAAFLYGRLQVRRGRFAANLGMLGMVRQDPGKQAATARYTARYTARSLRRRRHLPAILYLIGLALLGLAMARPEMVVALPRIEGTVILAFDVSASMGAEDMQPNRIEAAKQAARLFVEQQPENFKIGVVAFSDGGLLVQAPTDDRAALVETIDRFIPQSGTSLGQGILVALNTALETPNPDSSSPAGTPTLQEQNLRGALAPAVIVLLTDGENTEAPDPLETAQIAIEQGVRIYTVGIGSRDGTVVEIDGFNVFTRLNEDLLKEIAQVTEGEYFYAADEADLQDIYKNLDLKFVVKPEKMEITSLLTGLSFVVLMVGGGLALAWFGHVP